MSTLERIEAKIDSSPQPAERPAEIKEFASYIKNTDMVDTVLNMLHSWIDENERVKALVYIKAAMDAQVLSRPPYNIAEAEFPKKAWKQVPLLPVHRRTDSLHRRRRSDHSPASYLRAQIRTFINPHPPSQIRTRLNIITLDSLEFQRSP